MKILNFLKCENFEIWTLKFLFFEILEFLNFMKFYENWNFWEFLIFLSNWNLINGTRIWVRNHRLDSSSQQPFFIQEIKVKW